MSQKIKVQDGNIVYSNTDPTQPVNMTVLGDANVTNQLIVGSVNTPADGVISSGDGYPAGVDPAYYARLDIIAGNYGTLNLSQSSFANSAITINGVQWPTGVIQPTAGMFLGATSSTSLEYTPFIIAYNPNDSLTEIDLNALYPTATAGQSVAGITVLYTCVGTSSWRILGKSTGGAAPLNEIVYGTGPGTTSTPDLTYDSTTGTLTVGPVGPATISSGPLQSIVIGSDTSITLDAPNTIIGGSTQLGLFTVPPAPPANGMVYYDTALNRFRGYQASNWVDLTPPPEYITELANGFPMYAEGSYYYNWYVNDQQTSPDCTGFSNGTAAPSLFTLNTPGSYKVTITGRIRSTSYPEGPLPTGAMMYGIQLGGSAYANFNISTHTCGDASASGWSTDGLQNQLQWTDTFYVMMYDTTPVSFSVGVYANKVVNDFQYNIGCMMSVVRTSGTPIQPL